jgi:phosphoglycerate dehydrogenase-like enzyme
MWADRPASVAASRGWIVDEESLVAARRSNRSASASISATRQFA